jgi:methylated-DNA-[protein]-cysteine S-methyltransferase
MSLPKPIELYYDIYESPVGPLVLIATDSGLAAILFTDEEADWQADLPARFCNAELQRDIHNVDLLATHRWLDRYFSGEVLAPEDFEGRIDAGGSEFQRQVWTELTTIPYGRTTHYGEIAQRVGDPRKSRAVGLANGQNPLPILWPCHRVIGKNGKLVGFGGGLWRKEKLLALEQGGRLF